MASQVSNYKCPACTGPLRFDEKTQGLECDYCGGSYTLAEIQALVADNEENAADAFNEAEAQKEAYEMSPESAWDMNTGSTWSEFDSGVKAYTCQSCGAQIICDTTTAATKCPYCDNQTIIPGQLSGEIKPDLIIPFKIDKKQAEAKLREASNKYLIPKTFKSDNKIKEVKGVYVPFWLYDASADADITFEGTKKHTKRSGNEEITTTEYFYVRRAGDLKFVKVPADGATKMPDDYMDALEPYNYNELVEFSTVYLPGFLADRYDVSAEENAERVDRRCRKTAIDIMSEDARKQGYDTLISKQADVSLARGKVSYALLPVWMFTTKFNGKDYMYAINGQTGKSVGSFPVDEKKYWRTFFGIGIGLSLFFMMMLCMMN